MGFANEILDAIEIMVRQVVEDNTTKIYTGVCKTTGVNNCVLTINGKDNTVKYYGGVPVVGTVYQVFIPFGNMSAAFIIVPGSGGGSGGGSGSSGVNSVNGKTGDVVLNAADVGLGNVDNIKQYSESNPPPYPVTSVNGMTGNVTIKPKCVTVTLSSSGWDSTAKTQTATVSGVLADETKQLITPAPALASQTAYYNAGIRCTGQSANKLTFTAKTIPTADLTVYVTIQGVGA